MCPNATEIKTPQPNLPAIAQGKKQKILAEPINKKNRPTLDGSKTHWKKYIKRKPAYDSSISSSFTIGNVTAATIVSTFPSSRKRRLRVTPHSGIDLTHKSFIGTHHLGRFGLNRYASGRIPRCWLRPTSSGLPTVSDASYCTSLRSSQKIIGITQLVHPLHLPLHQLPTTSHRNDQQLGYPYIPQIITNKVVGAR